MLALATALALIPTLLNLLHVPDAILWPVSSAVAGAVFTLVLVLQFRRRRLIEPGPFPAWVVLIYVVSMAAVGSLWLNVAGTPFRSGVGPYAAVLTWAICVFGFIFVRTMEVFLHRPPPPDQLL